jgi:carbon storage regulator
MLVIARKVGQTILIGDDIEITVSAVRGDQVRLAINAPRTIGILRKETVEQVELGNAAAIESAVDLIEHSLPTTTRPPFQDPT